MAGEKTRTERTITETREGTRTVEMKAVATPTAATLAEARDATTRRTRLEGRTIVEAEATTRETVKRNSGAKGTREINEIREINEATAITPHPTRCASRSATREEGRAEGG